MLSFPFCSAVNVLILICRFSFKPLIAEILCCTVVSLIVYNMYVSVSVTVFHWMKTFLVHLIAYDLNRTIAKWVSVVSSHLAKDV